MEGQNNLLKLTYYKVKSFHYEVNEEFYNLNQPIEVPLRVKSNLNEIDKDNFSLDLEAIISNAEKFPFNLTVIIEGGFMAVDWKKAMKQIELKTTAILFPYMRALLTTLTATAGINPIILPIVNVEELINRSKE